MNLRISKLVCCGLLAVLYMVPMMPAGYAASSEPRGYDRAVEELKCGHCQAAHRHLMSLARHGHARSQTLVGLMYEHGAGVPKDLGQAAQWYEKAAQQGVKEAENQLGHLYLSTENSIHNPAKAEQWLSRAAEHGVTEAQRDLGMLYLHGGLATTDHDKAVRWLQSAARQGSSEAQAELAKLPGTKQLENALAQNSAAAQTSGQNVSQGIGNIEQSWEGYAGIVQSVRAAAEGGAQSR